MFRKRRSFSAQFRAKVALEALKEQETLNQIASRRSDGVRRMPDLEGIAYGMDP